VFVRGCVCVIVREKECVCFCERNRESVCVFVCVCSLSYPACNAHSPYRHLWPARIYSIFPHYLLKA